MRNAAVIPLIGAVTLVACTSRPSRDPGRIPAAVAAAQSSQLPAKPPRVVEPGYTLTDSTEWGNLLDGGDAAVLRRRGDVIDTIDLGFGVAFAGRDSLVFQPVRFALDTVTHPGGETFILRDDTTDEFVLWTPAERRLLREWLPHFDSHFSCAEFFAGALHYWGIARGTNGLHRLYAMRYDFRSAKLDSIYVRDEDLATDYRYYLRIPRARGDQIAYGSTLIDPHTWQIVRDGADPVVPPEPR